jgi:ABC-type glycerol-3-phosphate transport system permease component
MSKIVELLKGVAIYVFALLFAAFFIFPLFWMWVESFKSQTNSFSLAFIPWLQYKPTLLN